MTANFVFWNIPGPSPYNAVGRLAAERESDIVMLAECGFDDATMEKTLREATGRPFRRITSFVPNIRLFSHYSRRQLHAVDDSSNRAVVFKFRARGLDLLIACVHLPSKLTHEESTIEDFARRLAAHVRSLEIKYNTPFSVVAGDFNLNPFDAGVVSSDSFHAISSAAHARRLSRTVFAEQRRFFYNPMWNHLGDRTPGPPGTVFYSRSGTKEYFWHMIDQVLLRPQLIPYLKDLEIVTEIGGDSLLTKKSGRPDRRRYSDHLPIAFTLGLDPVQ